MLAPLVVAFPPLGRPGATAIGTAFSLAALSTVLAYLVAFRLIAVAGPVATSAATYLMPPSGRRTATGGAGSATRVSAQWQTTSWADHAAGAGRHCQPRRPLRVLRD